MNDLAFVGFSYSREHETVTSTTTLSAVPAAVENIPENAVSKENVQPSDDVVALQKHVAVLIDEIATKDKLIVEQQKEMVAMREAHGNHAIALEAQQTKVHFRRDIFMSHSIVF